MEGILLLNSAEAILMFLQNIKMKIFFFFLAAN